MENIARENNKSEWQVHFFPLQIKTRNISEMNGTRSIEITKNPNADECIENMENLTLKILENLRMLNVH